jgi:hypothetical protein
MELNFKTMASAYLNVLEGYDFIIPEDVPANERTAFHGAAAAAHKSGKSHFDFGGKKYPVTMKKDAAKAINSDTQKEAKEDEPEASTEVDGNDEKEAGMKKVPCPKCEGKGCAHCDEKGYHMSKVESSCGSDGKKSRKESVEEETELNELSAEEKKLVNQMYDKKGNLTPLGKKVMNHGKKPGDKGYVENTNESIDEVLDTPKAYNSYMRKSKTSANRAHTALTLGRRNPKDIKQANKTLQKRDKGHDMAKRVKDRQWNKAVKKGYVNDSLGESFDHSIHQDHAFAHHSAAMEHEDHGNHEAAAHHHKASNHHDEAHAAHEKGDHSVGAYHAAKALHHASKAVRYSMKSGGEHQDISRHAYNDSKDTHDATPQSSGHSAVSVSKLTRRESVNQVDEISRSMTPMKNKFGGTVIPKKFDAYKKFVKKNNVDEPTVRMICDNPDAAESKRMMKNPKIAQAVDLYKAAHMKKESVSEKKKYLSQKDIKRAIASIKPPKKKPTLPKAPWDKKESTLPSTPGGKKTVRSADKKPVNVNVDGKTITRMEPVTKRSAAAYESVNRENWVDVLQNKKLQEAEDAKTKTSAPTGNHKSDDATRDTYDKQLATRKGEKDFVDMHNPETPEYADVNRVLPKTFAAFTAGVKAGGGKTNDAPGDKAMPKNDGK